MTEAALALSGVVAGYGPRDVLRGVDLAVAPGEVVGLIGPNGSGKTTAVRVASRALRPRRGSVRVLGLDPYAASAREVGRRLAVVPQEVAPVFSFTALEVVLMGRSPYRSPWGGGDAEDYRRARAAMETAQVHHLTDRPLEALSGGEKQRVILAQALAQDAPVLLLDEPTTHLDAGHVLGILDTVRSLAREESRAVLAIFHDLNLAAAYCDRLVALDAGAVAAEGSPGEVVTRDLLERLYGVQGEVTPHFATGRPTVLLGPPIAPARRGGLPRAHVIGGAGRGAPAMHVLAERGYEVTTGVLHGSDTDAVVAERMNLERVVVPPFSAIDAAAEAELAAMLGRAELIVICDAPYGPGNVANLRVVAATGVPVVIVETTPIAERDFTGGEAARLWGTLRERARVVGSYGELAEALG